MRLILFTTASLMFLQARATKDQAPVLETKYFRFYNNICLNTHLFLYQTAVQCKHNNTPADSIPSMLAGKNTIPLDEKEMVLVKSTVLYYRDSIIAKNLLFDPEMTLFSDMLVKNEPAREKMNAWQKKTWEKINGFQVLYLKIHSRQFNRQCADWIMYCKKDILALEDSVMKQLQAIYRDTLKDEKIRVDLTCYATWAGAFSYTNTRHHILIDAGHKNNRKEAGVEILFHETSHFMTVPLEKALAKAVEGKEINKDLNLWHNILFYTTAVVLDPLYKNMQRPFTPYYITQGFEEKFPVFKTCTDAFRQYWNAYISGDLTMEDALDKIVDYLLVH